MQVLLRLAAVLVLVAAGAGSLSAATYYMTTTGDDSADGLGWGTPWLTFTNAINRGANGDKVWVSNGTYQTSVTITNSKSITFESVNGRDVTSVDANATSSDPRRVFYLANTGAVLNGFTIKGGVSLLTLTRAQAGGGCPAGDPGAGIYMTGGTVRNCTITGNSTYWFAAGIWLSAGLVDNCLIYSNTIPFSAHDGCCNWENAVGGVYIAGANATVQNCQIFGNTGTASGGNGGSGGGGAGVKAGKLLNSVIRNNVLNGGYGGSGINIDPSGGLVSNCIVYANSGNAGGRATGIQACGGVIVDTIVTNCGGSWAMDGLNGTTLRNVLIANNAGIAFRAWAGGTMENCTVARNNYGIDRQSGASLVMVNCIIYSNTTAAFYNSALPVYMSNSCCSSLTWPGTFVATNSITSDPRFAGPTNSDFRLQPGSPAINAGMNLPWHAGARELAGGKRVNDRMVDMGAYEAPPSPGTQVQIR